jgi:hypothetical protein
MYTLLQTERQRERERESSSMMEIWNTDRGGNKRELYPMSRRESCCAETAEENRNEKMKKGRIT